MRTLLILLSIACFSFAPQTRADDESLELYFAGKKSSEALVIGGIYANNTASCIDIIIDGVQGHLEEVDGRSPDGSFDLPVEDLCVLTLLNMDQERSLLVRFADSIRNLALLNDQRWTTSGSELAPSSKRSFSIILSRRSEQSVPLMVQYQGSNAPPETLILNLTSGE